LVPYKKIILYDIFDFNLLFGRGLKKVENLW